MALSPPRIPAKIAKALIAPNRLISAPALIAPTLAPSDPTLPVLKPQRKRMQPVVGRHCIRTALSINQSHSLGPAAAISLSGSSASDASDNLTTPPPESPSSCCLCPPPSCAVRRPNLGEHVGSLPPNRATKKILSRLHRQRPSLPATTIPGFPDLEARIEREPNRRMTNAKTTPCPEQ